MRDTEQLNTPAVHASMNGAFGEFFSRHNVRISRLLLIALVTLPLIVISIFAIRSVHTEALVDVQQDDLNKRWVVQSLDRELQAYLDGRVMQYMEDFRGISVNDNDLRWWLFKHPPLEMVLVYSADKERRFPPTNNQSATVNELRLIEQLRPEFASVLNRDLPFATYRSIVKGIRGPMLLSCHEIKEWFVCLLVKTEALEDWLRQSLAQVALATTHWVSIEVAGLPHSLTHPAAASEAPHTRPAIQLPFEWWEIALYDNQPQASSNRPLLFSALLLPLFFFVFACGYGLYRLEKIRQEQLVAQQQFTAELAHEIRTPLANIRLYTDLMERSAGTEQAHYGSVIVSEIRRLSLLVDNAILLERAEQTVLGVDGQASDPDQVILETLETMQPMLDEQQCRLDLELGIARNVRFDRDALQRVLINLLDNAGKYAAGCRLRLLSRLENHCLHVDFSDHGPGLPEDLWDQVLSVAPQRINSGGQGFGLGLRVCLCLCRRTGGQMDYLPAGSGCHFRIRLPVIDPQGDA